MNTLKNIVLVLDLITAGLSGALAGSSDSFMAKGGSSTMDAKLAKATKWIGLCFVVLSLITVILVSSVKATAKNTTSDTTPAITTQAPEDK